MTGKGAGQNGGPPTSVKAWLTVLVMTSNGIMTLLLIVMDALQ